MVTAGTYEWKLSPYMRIIGTISNIEGTPHTDKINSYSNSGLQRMYDGLRDKQMCLKSQSTAVTLDLELRFEIQNPVSNSWDLVDPQHHGMVFADSESMDGVEYITCFVEQSSNWYIIDKPTAPYNANDFNGTEYRIIAKDSIENSVTRKFIKIDNPNAVQIGATTVMFAKGVSKFTKLNLKGSGTCHIMLGYFINHDPSNAVGYENAMHFQEIIKPNNNNAGTFYTLGASTIFKDIANLSIPGAKLTTDAYFGNAPNVEAPYNDSLANLDALTQGYLLFKGYNDTVVTYNIKYTNNFGTKAYIYAFVDFNKNGTFETAETAIIEVGANTSGDTTIKWDVPNVNPGNYVARFRITTDLLVNLSNTSIDERSVGLARNGEVTDRIIRILPIEKLPLHLAKFEGIAYPSFNELNWETHKEEDIIQYIVERSTDAVQWHTMTTINANNNLINHYTIKDESPAANTFYRLKIEELNGVSYSRVINLNRSNDVRQEWSIYPQIVQNSIYIKAEKSPATFMLLSSNGTILKGIYLTQQVESIALDDLPQGIYYITDRTITKKFIKQ